MFLALSTIMLQRPRTKDVSKRMFCIICTLGAVPLVLSAQSPPHTGWPSLFAGGHRWSSPRLWCQAAETVQDYSRPPGDKYSKMHACWHEFSYWECFKGVMFSFVETPHNSEFWTSVSTTRLLYPMHLIWFFTHIFQNKKFLKFQFKIFRDLI